MVRPRLAKELRIQIKQLRSEGKSIDTILAEIGEDRVSRGSVAKYVKEYDKLPEAIKRMDLSVDFLRFEEFGFQWPDASFILKVWADIGAGPLPTIRDAKWWLRLHQLAPEATYRKVYVLALHLIWRERLEDWGNVPPNDAAVWGQIAFHPWTDWGSRIKYEIAMSDGRVENLRDIWTDMPKEGLTPNELLQIRWHQQNAFVDDFRPYIWDRLVDEQRESTTVKFEEECRRLERKYFHGDTKA